MVRLLLHSLLESGGGGGDGAVCVWGGGGGVRLKLEVQSQGNGKILDVDGHVGWGVLKIRQFSWTSYVCRPLKKFA